MSKLLPSLCAAFEVANTAITFVLRFEFWGNSNLICILAHLDWAWHCTSSPQMWPQPCHHMLAWSPTRWLSGVPSVAPCGHHSSWQSGGWLQENLQLHVNGQVRFSCISKHFVFPHVTCERLPGRTYVRGVSCGGWGYSTVLVNYAARRGQEVNTANSPRPVTVRAEIKIETDNGPMTNSAENSDKVML